MDPDDSEDPYVSDDGVLDLEEGENQVLKNIF